MGGYYRHEKPYNTWDTLHKVGSHDVEASSVTTECGITFVGTVGGLDLTTDLDVPIQEVPDPAKCGRCFR